jgi:CelD/BcsL family acetyltransferase involved in cellulose biosynthesis
VNLPLTAEVQVGLAALERLRAWWDDALQHMTAPSAYITPEFIECSLRHLTNPGDEPWFVVVRRGDTPVGLLPLLRSTQRHAGVPVKVLGHAGALSGDRPGLVHLVEADAVWQAALQALFERQADWQVLDLRELDEGSWPLDERAFVPWKQRHLLRIEHKVWTHAGFLPLTGSWDDYLASRSRNARQDFRRRERRLREDHPDVHVEVIDDPAQIAAGFDRYLAIEARGWKHTANVGLWSDRREHDLHRDLLPRLATSGRASVWLLRTGDTDIAGLVRMRQGGIVYERHSTYDPEYSRYSPSTQLCMEAVRRSFGTDCHESDVLGMAEPLETRLAIYPWYPGKRRTWRLLVVKAPWYLAHWMQLAPHLSAARARARDWLAGKAAQA